MIFQQTTPPKGWTKETTAAYDDSSPRIVTGSVSNGGSVAFSTLFARTATDGHQLTLAEMPSHAHTQRGRVEGGGGSGNENGLIQTNEPVQDAGENTKTSGLDQAHSHDIDMQVKYYDVVIGIKA